MTLAGDGAIGNSRALMDVAGQVVAADLPWGVRSLEALHPGDAVHAGDELADIAALRAAGVPCAPGWLVALSGDAARERLSAALGLGLGTAPGARVLLRPLFPTRGLAARFERRPDLTAVVDTPSRVASAAAAFLASVGASEVTGALGGSLARLSALVVVADAGPRGRAASADPVHGDPDQIRVWETAVTPWLVDRRTTRVTVRGEGELDEPGASSVADLADRAQLVLGFPVEIGWVLSRGRPVIAGVRPLSPAARFTTAPYRIVTLISEDEGCVAPLAVDALDKAVQGEVGEPGDEPRVRRIYARPYRRMEETVAVSRRGSDPASLARSAARAGRVAADVAAPLAAARAFERSIAAKLAALDAVDLFALEDRKLLEELRDRHRLVIEAFALLDRGRIATIAVLAALETTVGPLPREVLPAVARPKPSRTRKRLCERMARLARRIESEQGELVHPSVLPAPLRRKWDELRRDLVDVRPLGIDVRPLPYGRDDDALLATMRAAPWEQEESRERARRDALRRIMATARQRPFGRSREAIAGSLALIVHRVAKSKGATSEALAAAMLRLRRAACEAGRRLAELGLVEDAEDALYLSIEEIAQGLSGEPGAYAARVRLRREDDLRWARYAAPRRIAARR